MTGRMMMRRLVLIVAALRFLITTTALTTTDGDETYTKNNSNNNNNNAVVNQTSVLLKTSIVYGALLVLGWILFCWVRQRFPRPYTIRQWSTRQDLKTPLADDTFGFFSWMWKLRTTITEEDLLEHCGMDALCFLRTLDMGTKLCLVGMFNSLWLIPIYSTTTPSSSSSSDSNDYYYRTFLSHRPTITSNESWPFFGAVMGSYLFFGYTHYLILQEFRWFIQVRHRFLQKRKARNYTIFVRDIPANLASNTGMESYFRRCFAPDLVLEARLHIRTPNLARLIQHRQGLITKIERKLVTEEKQKSHNSGAADAVALLCSDRSDSLEGYIEELKGLNTEITRRVEQIEQSSMSNHALSSPPTLEDTISADVDPLSAPLRSTTASASYRLSASIPNESVRSIPKSSDHLDIDDQDPAEDRKTAFLVNQLTQAAVSGANRVKDTAVSGVTDLATTAISTGMDTAQYLAGTALTLLTAGGDGAYCNSGFVSFRTLSATNAALQMVHYNSPFELEVLHAPEAQDVIWSNVGRPHQEIQFGKLLSLGATATVCLFWTIPMAFFSALSSVESLEDQFDWIADAIEKFPLLRPLLQLIAPLLVLLLNSSLPIILRAFTMLEGPVSGSVVEASTFPKLAMFMIVQTFFVSALSGSIAEGIKHLIEKPASIIDLLAQSLPAQSGYFTQLVFIDAVMSVAWGNFRFFPLMEALGRRCIGPRVTRKDQETKFLFLHPLADPYPFRYAWHMGKITVLYFTILLVYQTIAPLISYAVAFAFLIAKISYRHHFVFVYPNSLDSGGVVWTIFVKILLGSILISEFTIVGLLSLKKATVAAPLMIPLIVITIIFNGYIRQRHFQISSFLPSRDCMDGDDANGNPFEIVHESYLQPSLKGKVAYPTEGLSKEVEEALGYRQIVPNNDSTAFFTTAGLSQSLFAGDINKELSDVDGEDK